MTMNLRQENIQKLGEGTYDALVVGGGINGAVSAAALTAFGARVALVEANDFASFTSEHSSNLVWGGIKYMETYEFNLVSDLCKARNELIRRFPSTVKEIRFLASFDSRSRYHPSLIYAGAWLYWLIGRGFTRIPKYLTPSSLKTEEPVIETSHCRGGVEYSDAYLFDNDARFVFNFIRSALDSGCIACNYVRSENSQRENDLWVTTVKDQVSGQRIQVRSRLMVNATGAFVDHVNSDNDVNTEYQHLLSKGVHLIVPRITKVRRVLAFFADDGRLFFAIPMANRTCIGTTDTPVSDAQTKVSDEDRNFILSNINSRLDLEKPLAHEDIIAERCGVRPLAYAGKDGEEIDFLQLSRKHILETDPDSKHISIFGGKITDCINIGEEICEQARELGIALKKPRNRWYGEPPKSDRRVFDQRAISLGMDELIATDTGESYAERLWRRYGNDAITILSIIESDRKSIEPVIEGKGLRRCEVEYLARREMIVNLEDLLRRRSKLEQLMRKQDLKNAKGLMKTCKILFGDQAQQKFDEYFSK